MYYTDSSATVYPLRRFLTELATPNWLLGLVEIRF